MALTNWNDILNKPKGIDEVPEIALTVEQLSASVLSLGEDVGEIALDVSELSTSILTIGEKVDKLTLKDGLNYITGKYTFSGYVTASGNYFDGFIPFNLPDNVSNITISAGTVAVYTSGGSIIIPATTTISITDKTPFGFSIEIPFATAQTADRVATVAMTNISITIS